MTVYTDEPATRAGVPSRLARSVPPLSDDLHEAMGQLMAEVIRQGRRVDEMAIQLTASIQSQARERPELVHSASTTAAKHTSNRLAALLGALAILYTEAAPVLHELWRSLHR